MTYAGGLHLLSNLNEELLILCSILASNEDLDREAPAFDLIQMLRYKFVRK